MTLEEIVIVVNGKIKKMSVLRGLFCGLALNLNVFHSTIANDMPVGAEVQSGNVKISGPTQDHMIIDQSSNKSIINWNGFSIHKNGRVDFKHAIFELLLIK